MISLDANDKLTRSGGISLRGYLATRGTIGKERSIMSVETGSTATRPADVGLRREIGLIGATWASETSIIGSGWLFAGMGAAVLAGPAAIYGWLI